MKRIKRRAGYFLSGLALTIFTLVSHATVQPPLVCVPPPNGMVSWWPGDGNAFDIVGTNHGALYGDATFSNGLVADSFSFDGTGDYVEISNSPSLQINNAFSVDCWVYPRDHVGSGIVTMVDNAVEGSGWHIGYYGTNVPPPPDRQVAFTINASFTTYTSLFSPAGSVPFNTWTHIAATSDGTTMRLYINGVQVDSTASPPVLASTFTTLFGAYQRNGIKEQFFNGLIDEVEIFNRALTASEVQAIVNAGSAGKCKPDCAEPPANMLSWWPGDGNADDIQSNNDGTLHNGVSFAPGMVGQAFSFDGMDDVVSTPLTVSYENGATFDAWIKTTDDAGLVVSDGGGVSAEFGMGLFLEPSGTIDLFGAKGTNQDLNFHVVGPFIADGAFHHVAGTWTGDTATDGVRLYVDGVLVGTATAEAPISTGSTPIHIGWHTTVTPNSDFTGHARFAGLIDEVEVFNRALTASEIQAIFAAGSAGKCKDTDEDGVPDAQDNCPNSIVSTTVIIDGCDSGVPNTVFPNGCTISDRIQQCASGAQNHGQFVSCVAHLTNELKKAGIITGQQKGAIQSCAAQSNIP